MTVTALGEDVCVRNTVLLTVVVLAVGFGELVT
jgi:hypothetical protein